VGGPGAKIMSAEGPSEDLDCELGEGGRVEAMEEGVEFSTCYFVGEAKARKKSGATNPPRSSHHFLDPLL